MSGLLSNLLNQQDVIQDSKKLIEEVYQLNDLPWVIGYSGGKDSTATTQLIIDTLIDMSEKGIKLNKKIYIISSNTMVENPMIINTIHDSINKLNSLSSKLNLPISAHIIQPKYSNTFFVNMIGKGYPAPNQTFRWCTDRLKIDPANQFIKSLVDEFGEVVMILGVRTGESNSRDRVLESHTIEGKKLMVHTTMPNAYVFAPIRAFTTDDVWNYLLTNKSPWGSDNNELFKLYNESITGEECPLIMDEAAKQQNNCGNSRFGCWMCTVVKEDKSLTGFIKSGHHWLSKLLEYRNWIYEIRDNNDMRMKRRTNGTIYFSKIKTISDNHLRIVAKGLKGQIDIKLEKKKWIDNYNEIWQVFTGITSEDEARKYIAENNINLTNGNNPRIIIQQFDGEFAQLAPGPFTLESRKLMLEKLLILEKDLNRGKLITLEEINEIRKIWTKHGDYNDSAKEIYNKVYENNNDLQDDDFTLLSEEDIKLIKDICKKEKFDVDTFLQLLDNAKTYAGYKNRTDSLKEVKKIFNKEFLLVESGEEDEN